MQFIFDVVISYCQIAKSTFLLKRLATKRLATNDFFLKFLLFFNSVYMDYRRVFVSKSCIAFVKTICIKNSFFRISLGEFPINILFIHLIFSLCMIGGYICVSENWSKLTGKGINKRHANCTIYCDTKIVSLKNVLREISF